MYKNKSLRTVIVDESKEVFKKQRFGIKKREKGKLLKIGMEDGVSGDKGRG